MAQRKTIISKRNENGDIKTETEIQKNPHILIQKPLLNKEMVDFLDRFTLPKVNQEQINYVNWPIPPKKIEVYKNLPNKKRTPERFSAEFYQAYKEELILILFKNTS